MKTTKEQIGMHVDRTRSVYTGNSRKHFAPIHAQNTIYNGSETKKKEDHKFTRPRLLSDGTAQLPGSHKHNTI